MATVPVNVPTNSRKVDTGRFPANRVAYPVMKKRALSPYMLTRNPITIPRYRGENFLTCVVSKER
eukprot:2303045-Pyramimonas_sp.AAC.1